MSERNDREGVLHRFVTRDQAERLLSAGSSELAPDAGFADVASLFSAMREPATPEETVHAHAALAAFTAALRDGPSPAEAPARKLPAKAKFVKRKAFAAMATTAVLFGGAAAAATGSLPGPVQDGVSKSLSHLGMDLPAAHDATDNSPVAPNDTTTTIDAVPAANDIGGAHDDAPTVTAPGPDADGAAKKGLCTAYAASPDSSGKNLDSPAFHDLTDAASKAGKSVDDYCADGATPAKTEDAGKPADTGKPDKGAK